LLPHPCQLEVSLLIDKANSRQPQLRRQRSRHLCALSLRHGAKCSKILLLEKEVDYGAL
jgi:hypothetical protein